MQQASGSLQLHAHTRQRGADLFSELEYDAALVSPLVYAKDAGELSLVPGVSITSHAANNSIRLVFKEHLHHISRIALPMHVGLEKILTSIVLAEKYDMKPEFIEYRGEWHDDLFNDVDAALFTGDEAFRSITASNAFLDLIEEWKDLTDLPFVHAVCAMWNTRATPPLVQTIQDVSAWAQNNLDEVNRKECARLNISPHEIASFYETLLFTFDEISLDALNEFFRYAFFHGQGRDVPDIHLWSA